MERKQRSRAQRNAYLFAHTDAETANYFIKLWDSQGVGEIREDIDFSAQKFERKEIFTNNARDKLTEYGNSVALRTLVAIPRVERVCKFAKFDLEELQKRLSSGFADNEQRQNFIELRDRWFAKLKENMKELRISKETLETFGLNWKAAKKFAYQTI